MKAITRATAAERSRLGERERAQAAAPSRIRTIPLSPLHSSGPADGGRLLSRKALVWSPRHRHGPVKRLQRRASALDGWCLRREARARLAVTLIVKASVGKRLISRAADYRVASITSSVPPPVRRRCRTTVSLNPALVTI
jgi:hypothetical protein